MIIKFINMKPCQLFKYLEDRKSEIEWARNNKTTPSLKNIKYKKPAYINKKSMTFKTSLYAFLTELKP